MPTQVDNKVRCMSYFWQFYIDFEGHPDHASVKLALEEMKFFCKEIKILGVYKKSEFRKK